MKKEGNNHSVFVMEEDFGKTWTIGKIMSEMDNDPNVGAWLIAGMKKRFEVYALAIESGLMTSNEVRNMEGLPPLPEEPETNGDGNA